MRIAFVGHDLEMVAIARAVLTAGHSIDRIDTLAATLPGLRELASSIRNPEPWQTVLESVRSDAVVVGSLPSDAEVEDPLRQLLREGIDLLAIHPLNVSPLTHYELEAIRSEFGARLYFHVPARGHPLLGWLQAVVAAGEHGELGRIELVEWQRILQTRESAAVLAALSRDIVLLSDVCGELNRVMAWGGIESAESLDNLQVQLHGEIGCPVRWQAVPADRSRSPSTLAVVGEGGRIRLEMPEKVSGWQLQTPDGVERPSWDAASFDAASLSVEAWLDESAGSSQQGGAWLPAAHAVELADAVPRSAARGRAVELHFDEYSPQATFKGRMAALGCSLLMLGMLAVLMIGFGGDALKLWGPDEVPQNLEGALHERPALRQELQSQRLGRGWLLLLLLPMLSYLLLQLLPKLFGESAKSTAKRPRARSESGSRPQDR